MKKYTREQLKKRLIICGVLGIVLALAMGIFWAVNGGMSLIVCFAMIVGAGIVFPIELFGLTFNFGKFMLGMIAPIPILSMFIETFKAIFYAIKAIIVLVKKQEYLVIGKGENTDAE